MKTDETKTSPQRPLNEVLREVANVIQERRDSRDIIGLVRKPLSHPGGGDYLNEEVIGRRP